MSGSNHFTPTILSSSQVGEWSEVCDLLVIGCGIAGVSAAIEARESGLEVSVLERASGPGGTTAIAGGHFYLGGGTPVQTACGFEDNAEEMYKYLVESCPVPANEKCRVYADSSLEQFAWLERHGVVFERSYFPDKAPMQATNQCLIWSGNETVRRFREKARPAPRGHKVSHVGLEGGGGLVMQRLTSCMAKLGVRARYDTRVDALVKDDQGRIIGVRAQTDKTASFHRATRGVLLSTGAYTMNKQMLERYTPQMLSENVVQHGVPTDTGDGHLLGLAAGGQLVNMDMFFMTSPVYPPQGLLRGILVNNRGQRFVAEDCYHGRAASFIMKQPNGQAWMILDNETFDHPNNSRRLDQRLIDGWETIADMEAGLKLPGGSLQKTLAAYDRGAARGEDPEFGKDRKWLKPLDKAPFAAFDLSFGVAKYLTFTLGGLATSVDAEVLDLSGLPIPGLYAAGQTASNIAQDSDGYSSGSCLGEGSIFARRAARHAALAGAQG